MFQIKGVELLLHSYFRVCVYVSICVRTCVSVHPSHLKKSHSVQLSFLCKNELLCLPLNADVHSGDKI